MIKLKFVFSSYILHLVYVIIRMIFFLTNETFMDNEWKNYGHRLHV